MDKAVLSEDILKLLIIPIISVIFSGLYTKYLNKKREEKEFKKIDLENEKMRQEINSIKSSYQPIVLSTIQKTQDYLLEEKVQVLKSLIKIKSDLSKIEQNYAGGRPLIEDISEYYNEIYQNYNDTTFSYFYEKVYDNRYFFNDDIIKDIQKVSNIIQSISDERKRRESINPFNTFSAPKGFAEQMDKTIDLLDSIIHKTRKDLHLNSDFIHKFIAKNKI